MRFALIIGRSSSVTTMYYTNIFARNINEWHRKYMGLKLLRLGKLISYTSVGEKKYSSQSKKFTLSGYVCNCYSSALFDFFSSDFARSSELVTQYE